MADEGQLVTCTRCKRELPAASFRTRTRPNGTVALRKPCRDCEREQNKRYKDANRERKREVDKAYRAANRERRSAQNRRYREERPETVRAWRRRYYDANAEEIRAKQRERYRRQGKRAKVIQARQVYGITEDEAAEMYAAPCGICRAEPTEGGPSHHIDHDHALEGRTSVRGSLCPACNCAMGAWDRGEIPARFRDDLELMRAAHRYVANHAREVAEGA